MKTITIFTGAFLLALQCGKAQTFTGTGGIIHDYHQEFFPLTVSGLSPATLDTTFGLEQVCLDATHTFDSNLDFTLVAPDGTQIQLISLLGGGGQNFTGTCLNSTSATSITSQYAPFTGTFRPMTNLSFANNGQNGNGIWQLRVTDLVHLDSGTVNSWSITFGNSPAARVNFVSSDLPIVVINTNGLQIPDSPSVIVHLGIIDNGTGWLNHITDPINGYNGFANISIRGHSSQIYPKKNYSVETCDSLGNSLNVVMMGMPAENDWVLNANYSDKSMMRNVLTYHLSQQMGHYATRYKFCEVLINGQYMGIYDFSEKIKRDANRVAVSKLLPADADITGGYILKLDYTDFSAASGWYSSYAPAVGTSGQPIFFNYDYPKPSVITAPQKMYIQNYIDSFETALHSPYFASPDSGYSKYIDVNSFIDYFFSTELSRNVDGYRLSTYLYKKKDTKGNKLYIGPVWDYDIAYGNADYCFGETYTGWTYDNYTVCNTGYQVPFWWERLLQDTNFVNKMHCRWDSLRTAILTPSAINAYTDSLKTVLQQAQARNFLAWDELGIYIWPNPAPYDVSQAAAVARLQTYIANRLAWMDANLPAGHCMPGVAVSNVSQDADSKITVYPNPFDNSLSIVLPEKGKYTFTVLNQLGSTLLIREVIAEGTVQLATDALVSGAYTLRIAGRGQVMVKKLMKMKE